MPIARLRILILVLLALSTFINYIDRQALSVLLPTLRKELQLTGEGYGNITTLFLIAYTVSQFFFGMLIDRIGTRNGFILAISVWSIAAMAHGLVAGAVSLAVLRFLLGIGEAGNWPAGGKAVAEWFPRERRAFAMGIFDGGSALGAIAAPPLIAFLALQFGWRSAFVFTGLLGFLWLGLWLYCYEHPRKHPWLSPEERRLADDESAAANAGKSQSAAGTMLSLLGMRQLWGLVATRALATPVWWFYVFWLPDYLTSARHFTLEEIGMFAWIPFLTVDLGKMAGGAGSDHMLARGFSTTFARKGVMIFGALCMAAGLMVHDAPTSAAAIFWVSVATFGFGVWSANILALHADIFQPGQIASALGITGMGASAGGALATWLIGKSVDHGGYQQVFVAAGLAAAVACLALWFWIGTIKSPSAAR